MEDRSLAAIERMKRRTFLGIPIGAAATYIFKPDKDDSQIESFSYISRLEVPMERGRISAYPDRATGDGELVLKNGTKLTFKMTDLCWSVNG